MTVSSSLQPHPLVMVPGTLPPGSQLPPGALPLGLTPPLQDYTHHGDYGRHPADTDRFSPGR